MKNGMIAMMAALTLALCRSDMALGQFSYQSGTFGYRVLGQSLVPTRGTFSSGIQTNVAGSFLFLGRPNGGNEFASPWRHPYQSVIDQAIAALPPAELSLPPQQSVGGAQIVPPPGTPTPTMQIGLPAQSPPPGYNALVPSPMQGAGVTPGATAGATWNYALGQSVNRAGAAHAEPYVHSPELSARLTRIARMHRMLTGEAIDVYLSGNTALVQGVVRTAADRRVLGNVLGLEPDVSRIDNRLVVQGYGSLSSRVSTRRNVPQRAERYHATTTPAYGP